MPRGTAALAAAAAVAVLASCQVAQMQLAPSLAPVDAVAVAGANPRRWNTPVAFGPWRTEVAREGLKWDFAGPLLGLTAGFSFQPYRVVLSAGAQPIQAECITRAASLACGFRGRGDGTLRLRTTATSKEEGAVDFGDTRWTLRPVHRFRGSSMPSGEPLGYEFSGGDRVVAAVETINQGRVWIDPAVSPRDQERLAVAVMVLLLYDPADGD